ncbi:phage tail protein [Paenibacillus xylaniclasticus]|uniref:phage tail protein n=1 Tax=Paenibacillus xylaniclasticus TaxID=588083 RepID=UPI000FD91576|nr:MULTISPECIES: tail fiber protein [Paenibacillus]GFN33781.1 microcystin dependent MdpB family protein [Paenibacillus curdlanolyticus]
MEPYIGEIRMFAGNFAPSGWHICDGSILPISENEALFSLIGTTYGGDGQTTFALPDLRGRVPVGQGMNSATGTTYTLGQKAGTETVTLTSNELPAHIHGVVASSAVTTSHPQGAVWGTGDTVQYVAPSTSGAPMLASAVSVAGGGQPHDNMMPYLPIGYIIALEGIYPTQG